MGAFTPLYFIRPKAILANEFVSPSTDIDFAIDLPPLRSSFISMKPRALKI